MTIRRKQGNTLLDGKWDSFSFTERFKQIASEPTSILSKEMDKEGILRFEFSNATRGAIAPIGTTYSSNWWLWDGRCGWLQDAILRLHHHVCIWWSVWVLAATEHDEVEENVLKSFDLCSKWFSKRWNIFTSSNHIWQTYKMGVGKKDVWMRIGLVKTLSTN